MIKIKEIKPVAPVYSIEGLTYVQICNIASALAEKGRGMKEIGVHDGALPYLELADAIRKERP